MPHKGLFSTRDSALRDFLESVSRDPSPGKAFVARNFLLDEGINNRRCANYAGKMTAHKGFGDWKIDHQEYLHNCVFRPGNATGPPKNLDTKDMDLCPETFQEIVPGSPFLRADKNLHLLRVEEVVFIGSKSGASTGTIKKLGESFIANGKATDSDEYKKLADILEEWSSKIELRPVFSGFWEDFKNFPEWQEDDWANILRDRLGLLHLNPATRGLSSIDVFIFKYPVADVPKLKGSNNTHPLVPPTVLDGNFSAAFCPAPQGGLTGYTVDLAANTPPLRREVLHPGICFSPSHLWRVGSIDKGIADVDKLLREARGLHLLAVQKHTKRSDYAVQTDVDLWQGE